MSQLAYRVDYQTSFTGKYVDHRWSNEVVTGLADGDIEFGRPLYVSDWAGQKPVVKPITAVTQFKDLFGVSLFEQREGGKYTDKQDVAVLVKGVLWTNWTVGAITAGQPVSLSIGSGNVGKFKTIATVATEVTHYGLRVLSSAAAGVDVKLQLNLPSYYVTKS